MSGETLSLTIANPFPGLRSFEPDEEHLFFGREEQVDDLLARLRRTRFLAVVGTSGSGKSSLVRSGLIPALHSGFMVQAGSSWRIAILRPGSDPLGNLAASLTGPGVLGAAGALAGFARPLVESTLRRGRLGLVEAVRQARLAGDENLLIVVDQFEELFRFKRTAEDGGEEARSFVGLLLAATGQQEVPVFVTLTMRAEFFGDCTEFRGLAEEINAGQYLIPRLTREQQRMAIAGPVAVGGAAIAPRLLARLLNDVGENPDHLPILQHALMRTWDHWRENRRPGEPLDLGHYEAIGTMARALSLHAEEAYAEIATQAGRRIAELLFKRLTERGPDGREVRRPTPLAEICRVAGCSAAEALAVVERFRLAGRSFLMPPILPGATPLAGTAVLDISHESLMRIWRRLIDWVEEETRAAQIYLRLSKAAAQHQEGTASLLRGPELQLALNWHEETAPTAAWAARYDPAFERAILYLEQSRSERDRWLAKREEERRRQLRRARWLAIVLGTGALITLIFGLYALSLKSEAERSAAVALSEKAEAERQQKNATRQKQAAERERTRAERSQRAAEEQQGIAETERRRAEGQETLALVQKGRAERQTAVAQAARHAAETAEAATEEQRRQAVEQKERADILRSAAERSEAEARRLAGLQLARALALQTLRMQQGDQRQEAALLAVAAYRLHARSGGAAEDPDLYNALRSALSRLDPGEARPLAKLPDAVRALALTADGHTLALGGDDGQVWLLDTRRPGAPASPCGRLPGPIRALAAGPQRFAAGSLDGALRLWGPGEVGGVGGGGTPLPGLGAGVLALAFAPGGGELAVGGANGAVRLHHLGDLSHLGEAATEALPTEAPRRIRALAWSPDGLTLAAGSEGGGALLWDLRRRSGAPRTLAAGRDVRALAWSRDGGQLAAGTAGGEILLLTPGEAGAPVALQGHASSVNALAFGAGDLLASASADGSVRLWDPREPARAPRVLPDTEAWVWAAAFSADGERLFTGGADQTVRQWLTRTAALVEAVCRRVSRGLTPAEWSQYLPGFDYEAPCPNRPAGPSRGR